MALRTETILVGSKQEVLDELYRIMPCKSRDGCLYQTGDWYFVNDKEPFETQLDNLTPIKTLKTGEWKYGMVYALFVGSSTDQGAPITLSMKGQKVEVITKLCPTL